MSHYFSLKSKEEIAIMREAGRRLADVVNALSPLLRAGVIPRHIDARAQKLIEAHGALPAFLGYKDHGEKASYPATICFSVNDYLVHTPPGDAPLKEGDVAKLDIGLIYKKMYADMAITVGISPSTNQAKNLITTTKKALLEGIQAARVGNTIGDIGYAILSVVQANGFSVAEKLTGHGIGYALHESPAVFNTGRKGYGEELRVGMVLAIEPMVIVGKGAVKRLHDGSFVSFDGTHTAHFEHTVVITEKGPEILTV